MKALLVGLLSLTATAPAMAACTDYWGNQVYIQRVGENTVSLQFNTYLYPASGHLSYTGSRSVSHYFRGNGRMVEIEKSVFSQGQGRLWYHYQDRNSDRQRVTTTFTCR